MIEHDAFVLTNLYKFFEYNSEVRTSIESVVQEDIVEISNSYDDLGLREYYRHQYVGRTKGSSVDQEVEIQVAEPYSRELDILSLI